MRMRRRLGLVYAAALFACALAPSSLRAGTANGYTTVAPIASSFCTLTPSASTALSGCTTGMAANPLCILATITGANVNWRDDGTPTGTVGTGGQQVVNGATLWYCGTLTALRFIQQSATATVGVSFYK